MLKYLFFIIISVAALISRAQFLKAELGINGITCITCLHSTEKSFLQLDFIDSIYIDGEKGVGQLYFTKNKKVSLEKIASVIAKSGFLLRYTLMFYKVESPNTGGVVNYYDDTIYILNNTNTMLNGELKLSIIDKKFTTHREYKKWKKEIKNIKNSLQNYQGNLYFATLKYS